MYPPMMRAEKFHARVASSNACARGRSEGRGVTRVQIVQPRGCAQMLQSVGFSRGEKPDVRYAFKKR